MKVIIERQSLNQVGSRRAVLKSKIYTLIAYQTSSLYVRNLMNDLLWFIYELKKLQLIFEYVRRVPFAKSRVRFVLMKS